MSESLLLQLPAELLQNILTFLPATSLASLAQTCSLLNEHTRNEHLWHALVKQSLPAKTKLTRAYPASSFRELYLCHNPYLFLAKHKIWFSDGAHTGKLLIARYSHSRQTIEAYALAAKRGNTEAEFWAWNPEVIIHRFEPTVQLDLNCPIVRIVPQVSWASFENRVSQEIAMDTRSGGTVGVSSMFMHTRPLKPELIGPGSQVWPPHTLPAIERTRNASKDDFRSKGHKPLKASDSSESTFRIRRWMDYTSLMGVRRVGEDVNTYATLPAECYTPTKAKPWRGIWCGDYSGHGCEFLVVLQPDEPQQLPEGAITAIEYNRNSVSPESAGSWQSALSNQIHAAGGFSETELLSAIKAQTAYGQPTLPSHAESSKDAQASDPTTSEDTECSGQLIAVKLTGDPNIPRGEHTFIAPDIGTRGLLRIADEEIFKGARVVRSVGHIAARGYRESGYIPSQLILISHDTLAQYWEAFGHVSYYKRVDIDKFINVD